MNKISGVLVLLIALASPSAFAIKEIGNGGDPLALDFKLSLYRAIDDLKTENLRVNMETLSEAAKAVRVLVVDESLDVSYGESVQSSAAENFSSQNLIKINRAGWNAISNPSMKQALALHEVLSLLGIEGTADYSISQVYLSAKSGLRLTSASLQSVKIATPCPVPTADAGGLFKLIGDTKSTPANLKSYLVSHVVAADALNQQCQTPLMNALRVQREDLFRYLYDQRPSIDINAVQSRALPKMKQRTLFYFVVAYGSWPLINELRAKGGSLKELIANLFEVGTSEFMIAAGSNSSDVIKKYLQSGVDVNATTRVTKFSTLMLAAANNSAEAIETLISAGADVNHADTQGITPLMAAAHHSISMDVLRTLVHAGANVNARTVLGATPIYFAIGSDPMTGEVIKTLVSLGANVEGIPNGRATPLMQAANLNYAASVQALLEAGASVNATDMNKMTPLAHAAVSDQDTTLIMQQLVSAGANIEAIDSQGLTPVFLVSNENSANELTKYKALIALGANINVASNLGLTPLMYATRYSTLETLTYLVNVAGADRNSLTPRHASAWAYAKAYARPKVIQDFLYTQKADTPILSEPGQKHSTKAPSKPRPAPAPKRKPVQRRPVKRQPTGGGGPILGDRPAPQDPDPVCRLQVCP